MGESTTSMSGGVTDLTAAAAHWLKYPTADAAESTLKDCASAVIALIDGLDHIQRPWNESVRLGAVMLTARLHRRRNSPAGVEAFTEAGASYVSRYDSDISRLLGIDSFAPPTIG